MTGPVAVVTVVAGRHEHLRVQRAFLAAGDPVGVHVVVAVADPDVPAVLSEQPGLPTRLVELPSTPAGLPVAAARNAGAAAAIDAGADTLVFLDVDCVPAADLVTSYRQAVATHPDAVLCGPVTYLPPAPRTGWTTDALAAARAPHAARPDPAEGETRALPAALFWSLSFALTEQLWRRIGGFYEGYVGYGAEDTDFGITATRVAVPILMAGRIDAFHQHHPVSRPPVEHLDDIVRNSAVYAARHGELPMSGWLHEFEQRGLVRISDGAVRRTDAVRVATVPARHVYLDAALPPTVERVDVDRVRGWEPDPLLAPNDLARRADGIDVVHVHFGYDHLSADQIAEWVRAVAAHRLALVVTVHDLRNPHHDDPAQYEAQLAVLVRAADRVLTLTDTAAAEIARRYGRRPLVVAHPTLLDDLPAPRTDGDDGYVLVPLKALRRNVQEPLAIVAAAAQGAGAAGRRVRVLVGPAALEQPALRGITELDVDLDVTGWLPHGEVVTRVATAHACLLPYRFGTHSGWIELARDVGTHVIAPDCGSYAAQWPAVTGYGNNEQHGLDAASLVAAVADVCGRAPMAAADRTARLAQRDLVRAHHDALYREVARR